MSVVVSIPAKWPRKWIGDPELTKYLSTLKSFFTSVYALLDTPYTETTVSGSTVLTGLNDQVIIVTAAATITLPTTAKNQQIILIHNRSTGTVSAAGAINGDVTLDSAQQYDTMSLMYVTSLGEWILI